MKNAINSQVSKFLLIDRGVGGGNLTLELGRGEPLEIFK